MPTFSSDIYELISRMSSTEKSYFKKFGYKYTKENKAELILFDIIDKVLHKQPVIEESFEKNIMQSFSLKHKQQLFSKTKTNLYHDLLRSLRQFEKSKLNDEKIFEYYQFANILVKKNLFKESLVFIKKAEKLCIDNEFLELKILVSQLHAFALSRVVSTNKSYESINCLNNSLEDCNLLSNIILLQKQFFSLAFLQKKIGIANNADTQHELMLLENSLNDIKPESARASLYNLEALSIAAILKGNQNESFLCFQKILELLDTNPAIRENNLFKYLVVFEQYLQTVILSFQIELFKNRFEQFKKIETYSEQEKIWKENSEIFLLSIYALLNNSLNDYYSLESRFIHLASKNDYLLPGYRKISIAYYLTMGFFMLNDYEKVLKWYQYIHNNRGWGVRYDVDVSTRMVALISHYKISKYSVTDYFLINTKNFFKTKGKFKVELLFCSIIGKLLNEPDKKQSEKILKEGLEEIISTISSTSEEMALLNIFDVVSWLNAEVKKKSFYKVWFAKNFSV